MLHYVHQLAANIDAGQDIIELDGFIRACLFKNGRLQQMMMMTAVRLNYNSKVTECKTMC